MAVTWPTELPQRHIVGISDESPDTILRTDMDQGPAKVRQMFTAAPRFISLTLLFTGTQRATFDTFWSNAWAQSGADAGTFTGRDPIDGTTATYRFRDTKKPKWVSKYAGISNATARWEASLALEILP